MSDEWTFERLRSLFGTETSDEVLPPLNPPDDHLPPANFERDLSGLADDPLLAFTLVTDPKVARQTFWEAALTRSASNLMNLVQLQGKRCESAPTANHRKRPLRTKRRPSTVLSTARV
jgi:hypothetical protein